jgi:F0F1-type ATP synthase beta subunit
MNKVIIDLKYKLKNLKKNMVKYKMLYQLTKVVPFEKLSKKDLNIVTKAVQIAERSQFKSSHRLGACLEKESCILHR